MSGRLACVPLWWAEHLAAIAGEDPEVAGVYFLIVLAFCRTGGKLAHDPKEMCEAVGIDPRTFRRLWPKLEPLLGPSGYVRRKLEQDYAKALTTHMLRQLNGRLGGQAGGRPAKRDPQKPVATLSSTAVVLPFAKSASPELAALLMAKSS